MSYATVITLCILSYLMSTDLYTPSMPDIARDFAKSSNDVQTTMTLFLLGAVSSCFISGIIADHIGKKRVLLFGLAVAAIGSAMAFLSPTLLILEISRFLQGVSCTCSVIGFAAIQDLYPKEKVLKIMGLLGAMLAGIPAVAPMFGGYINTYLGWRINFVFLFLMFIASLLISWKVLPNSLDVRHKMAPKKIIGSYRKIIGHRQFITYGLLSPSFNSGEWFYLTFLPFYFQNQIGLSSDLYGLFIGITMVWFAAGSYFGSHITKAIGVDKTILLGLYTGLFSAVILILTNFILPYSAIAICVGLSFYLFGFGLLFPSSVSKSLTFFSEQRTRASSVRVIMSTSLAFLGSLTAEYVDDSYLMNLVIFLLLCVGVSIFTFHFRIREE